MTNLSAAPLPASPYASSHAECASAGKEANQPREPARTACIQATIDLLQQVTTAACIVPPQPSGDVAPPPRTPAASSAAPTPPAPSKPTTPRVHTPYRRRILPACAHAAEQALALARRLGASTLGALVGVFSFMHAPDDFSDDSDAASNFLEKATHDGAAGFGASAPSRPSEPLWDLFSWIEQSQSKSKYSAWLRLNGFAETPDGGLLPVQTVAWEIGEARRARGPVVLHDHNVPLLHPFAHSDEEIFTAYLGDMSKDGTFGSGTEARALAEALQVRMVVYQPVMHSNRKTTVEMGVTYGDDDAAHTLHIRHDGGGAHWEGVQRPQGTPDAQPLGKTDDILSTRGDGNCLFHAVAAALRATGHPRARQLKYDGLRALAVKHMREHAARHMPHVRLNVDTARGDIDPAQADDIDASAVQAMFRAHLHRSWDATWGDLVAHIDDVQSFNGALTPNATSRAMDRLFDNLLQRLGQVVQSQQTTPHAFLQRLNDIGASSNQTLDRTLGALSARQRSHLIEVFKPGVGLTLADAEAKYGPLFTSLALSDKLRLVGPAQTSKLVARMLQSAEGPLDALILLAQELEATLLGGEVQRPLSVAQWASVVADPAVLQGAGAAIAALSALPTQGHQAKWQALYRLVNAASPSVRGAFIQNLLRASPQAFADLGRVLNRSIPGNLPRDIVNRRANRAAVDVLFDCIAQRTGPT